MKVQTFMRTMNWGKSVFWLRSFGASLLNLLLLLQLVFAPLTPFTQSAQAASVVRFTSKSSKPATKPTTAARRKAASQAISSIVAFGPRRFDRLPGPTRNITQPFTVSGALVSGYTVRIQNGATDGSNRVSGVTILLNDAVVATARTININTPSLDVPVTLLATNTLSVRTAGAPGSYITISILARPRITSLVPSAGIPGASIVINGEGFDPSTPNQNIVTFARAGGGTTLAQVSAFSSISLTVVVPPDAATGPVTVQHSGGTATSPLPFTLDSGGPTIADFNPKRGPEGTAVTITGSLLKPDASNPTVTFTGTGNTRLPATITSASQTEIRTVVPTGAITGPIQVTNSKGSVTSVAVFSVEVPQDFAITLAPATATALQGGTATYIVSLTSNQTTFTQLAKLSTTGLTAGIKASFTPEQITAGATSTLTLVIPGNIAASAYNFTVAANALVEGKDQTRKADGSVNVQIAMHTTLSGRVLSTKQEPILGATVSIDGISVTTDAAGNFLLSGLAAGKDRPVMVDGRTASAPNRTYPVIAEPVTITAGQANIVPYTFYLPAIDTANEMTIVPGQVNVLKTPEVPGLSLTIPADAGLVNRDGSPVTRASLTKVEIDRTPAPLPANVGTAIVYTAQPGGARPANSKNMPVTYPNLGHADPGTRIPLYNFNHDTVQWYIYGYGRVSADGRLVVPEAGVGLPDFSWHFAGPMDKCKGGDCCKTCPCPKTSSPVDLSSGMKIEETTDVSWGGARGGIELSRMYTSLLAGTCDNCPFGRGFNHNYAIRLTGTFLSGGAGRILWPKDLIGTLFSDVRTDPDGTLVFNTTETPHQLSDVIRKLPNGTFEYRYKNGDVMRFDATGKLTAMVDRNNNTTSFTYTGDNLTQVTDPVGRSLNLQYSGPRITQVTDPLNRVWRYTYDGGGRLITATDPLNYSMSYTYDQLSRILTITDKRGNIAKSLTYDSDGRVIEQRYPDGGFERYSYTLSGMSVTSTTVTNALGRTKTMRFNGSGQVVGTTDELGQSSEIKRELTTNVALEIKGPCGCREDQRTYDGSGNPTAVTDRLNKTTQYEYDPVFNNVTRMTDRLGRVTTYTYDSRGNRTSMTNALNQTTIYGYDQFGQMASVTDALGHTTQIEYDAQGNVSVQIDALGNRTTMEYDIVGNPTAAVDPLLRRTEMAYDALDRLKTIIDTTKAITTYDYDENGNQIALTDILNHKWTNTYDQKNRLISYIDPLSRTSRMRYNTNDEVIATIAPTGRATIYDYDSRGNRIKMKDPLGNIVRFTYDDQGNLTTLSDQRGNITTFAYDEMDRITTQRDPLGLTTTYEYDFQGNLIAMVDRLGRRISVVYDKLNRREQVIYVDATVNYIYDPAGRLAKITDTQGSPIEWIYDDADRLLSETTPQGVLSYTYNKASQRTTLTVADRQPVIYEYDTAGRLKTITQGAEVFMYTYDKLSRIERLERPNGVKTEYRYDEVSRLRHLKHTNILNVALEDLQYIYNSNDEIEAIQSLTSATRLPGQTRTARSADSINRISQFGQASYTFDAEGQMQTKAEAGSTDVYEWDSRGRLKKVILPSGQTVSYGYDAIGRRSSRMAEGASTSFMYDGQDVVVDRIGSRTVEYLNGSGVDDKLRQTNVGSGSLYFLRDHLGSTAALVNDVGGIVEREQFEAYGFSGGSSLTRYGFTGRELDSMTGLIFSRARWYNPSLGSFLSEDPMSYSSGDINFYRYALNNPLMWTDPTGLKVEGRWISLPRFSDLQVGFPSIEVDLDWDPNRPWKVQLATAKFDVSANFRFTIECVDTDDCGRQNKWQIDFRQRVGTVVKVPLKRTIISVGWWGVPIIVWDAIKAGKLAYKIASNKYARLVAMLAINPTTYCLVPDKANEIILRWARSGGGASGEW